MKLVVPGTEHLPGYIAALERGWHQDSERPLESIRETLIRIEQDAHGFLASMDDPEGKAPPITLPNGDVVKRIPGWQRWMWDGEFCGSINFRWQPGTTELPPTCLGHIGYSVVPWKRGRGFATKALGCVLEEARGTDMPFVELTTSPANHISQKVIEANGGVLHEHFIKPPQFGSEPGLRYRVYF